ncbi:hypothetical protein O9929_20665 [Vibrio lentus]|nr:hypothetical protein [Vibrio lentus]
MALHQWLEYHHRYGYVTVEVTESLSKSLEVTTIDFTMSSLAEWSRSRLEFKAHLALKSDE